MSSADSDTLDAPLADYRQYYGLAQDPFREDPDFPFFGSAGRRTLLEQVQHLCQFSASLLAVLGKPGVGKTRLARELSQSFEPEDEICLRAAQPGETAADTLSALARSFALPVDQSPSVGQLLAALRHFAQAADEQDRLALAIIDDAQHLDEQTLGALTSLLQGQDAGGRRLHIVLFAEPEMVSRLDQFNMHDVLIHDFELAPLSLDEATDYLNFRMEMSDYMGPELFTERLVEPWWRQADGRMLSLHQSARQWLLESVSPPPAKNRQPLPLIHIVVVAALLGVLLMVFVYQGSEVDSSEPDRSELESSEPAGDDVVQAPDRTTQTLDLTQADNQQEVTPQAHSPRPQLQPLEPSTPDPVSAIEPEPLLEADSGQTPQSAAQSPESQASGAELEAATPATERPVADAETQPQEPSQEPSQEQPQAPSETLPDIPEDEQVLLSWRSTEYTLQLLGAGSRNSVLDYVSRQPNKAELLTFETRRQDKPWFVVVTGRFSNTQEARSAAGELPAHQREAGPWPRPLGEIQKEIEELRNLKQ